MAKNATTELGTEPVGKLLRQYAMPAIIAMTASSLYNLVDSIFIGHWIGAMALSGLAVAKPFMDICSAFGTLVGVGASSLLAIKFGQKDYNAANRILGNVLLLNLILGIIITFVGILWLRPILSVFGASSQTMPYAYDYMFVILLGNALTHIYFGLNSTLRSSGHPHISMIATIVAVCVNIILDPIFIKGLGMGVTGAALATVISQAVAVVWQLRTFLNPEEVLHIHRGIWHLDRKIVWESFAIGLSPFLMNIAHSLVMAILNHQLKEYGGDLALGAYGVVMRFTFVFAMIVMGLNQGMQPIVGYNYGAKKYDRMLQAFRLTALLATGVTTLVFLLSLFFPNTMVRIFTPEDELIAASAHALRITNIAFFVTGFQMVTGNFFTSIGMAGKSIFLSLTRQVLFLIPLSLIFPLLWGLEGVWISIPASDTLSAIIAGIMLFVQIRSFKKQHYAATLSE